MNEKRMYQVTHVIVTFDAKLVTMLSSRSSKQRQALYCAVGGGVDNEDTRIVSPKFFTFREAKKFAVDNFGEIYLQYLSEDIVVSQIAARLGREVAESDFPKEKFYNL